MKIAQISATFPPYMAGTGNVCYHNSIGLSKLGHDVTVFTSKTHEKDYQSYQSIKVVRLNTIFKIGNAPFLPGLLLLKKFDIIHLHYPFIFGEEILYFLKKMKKYDYIITYHNDLISYGTKNIIFNFYQKRIANKIINNAKKIIVLSDDYTENSLLSSIFQLNMNKVIVLPNGVDIKKFNPNIDYPENIKKVEKIILFVGALDQAHITKGLNFLILACSKILQNNRKFKLIVVGDGELKPYYQKLVEKEGLKKNVLFVGKIRNDDLPKYYSISDIFVLPSTVENFPLVVLEAMAMGKPVIASNIPGLRTIIKDQKTGYLVDKKNVDMLASKILFLIENEDIIKTYGINARKTVEEKYSWDVIIKKLEIIYKDMLS